MSSNRTFHGGGTEGASTNPISVDGPFMQADASYREPPPYNEEDVDDSDEEELTYNS